jgi:hypothetical protein
MDPNDPTQYYYLAYRHPHGYTWFGGSRTSGGADPDYGGHKHFIQSAVRHRCIPPKGDYEVAAITYGMYVVLYRKELVVS